MKVSEPGTRAISGAVLLTVSSQNFSSNPPPLVARIVMVCGLPVTVGLAQLTTPLPASMNIPSGPVSSDHVTGVVPLLSDGVGPVYGVPSSTESSLIEVITGGVTAGGCDVTDVI